MRCSSEGRSEKPRSTFIQHVLECHKSEASWGSAVALMLCGFGLNTVHCGVFQCTSCFKQLCIFVKEG
uniref:Uncharacterized protein n=1 Tax=Arundo donax TaxID=35708 RepID=A0A0A9ERG1_ARUDO